MIWLYILVAVGFVGVAYRWQIWRLPHQGLLALMYHHIGYVPKTDQQYVFTMPPERFHQQIDYLQKHGFTPIHTTELLAASSQKKPLPNKPVLFTFDDGTLDTFETLFPIVQKRRIKIVVFLITNLIGKDPDYMTWDQVRQMQQSGLVEFGSHTCSHARLRQLSNEDILKELSESKKKIEAELGVPCQSFCYPFGSGGFDKRVRPLVFQAGYQADFSTKQGINPWPWNPQKTILRAFPRGGETMLDFHLHVTRGRSRF